MKAFLINYNHGGQRYALELHATDAEDAKARLNSLLYGRVCGEVAMKLPAPLGPLAGLICSLRNAFGR
ncbi:MAG: hypothetical protein B7Y47_08215 [Sphingomonas sp. 28-63-12]|nr:MAG: hypothetical protein B7Y47_08215 [Sphingomonas sp. 28-63-12]